MIKYKIMDSLKIEIFQIRDKLYKNLIKEIHAILQAKLLSKKMKQIHT